MTTYAFTECYIRMNYKSTTSFLHHHKIHNYTNEILIQEQAANSSLLSSYKRA